MNETDKLKVEMYDDVVKEKNKEYIELTCRFRENCNDIKNKDKEIEKLNDKINSIFSNFEQFINSYKNDILDDFFIVLRLSEVIEFYNDLNEVIKSENRLD